MEKLGEFTIENIEDCTYGAIVFDPETETDDGIEIVHWCGYWHTPDQEDLDDLKKELNEDDQFGLVGISDRLEYILVDGDTFREYLLKCN